MDAITQHLRATRLLIAEACAQMKADDAEAYQGIAVASQRGASFRVVTSLSVQGLCESRVELVAPDGVSVNVATIAFNDPPTRQ
jgi:hypothetical protein